MKGLIFIFTVFLLWGAVYGLAAEDNISSKKGFTIGDFSSFSEKEQFLVIIGFRNGIHYGCFMGAGGSKGPGVDMCNALEEDMFCRPPNKARLFLLEIAKKDKYKNIGMTTALFAVLYGCLDGELDYSQVYKDLDDDLKSYK